MIDAQRISVEDVKLEPQSDLDELRNKAWTVAAIALVALGAGYVFGEEKSDFYRSYLVGWLFVLGIAAGLAAVNLLHHLTGGDWGVALRRVFEASGRTLPLFLVLALPIFWGLDEIYPWAAAGVMDPTSESYDALTAHKQAFLNRPAFIGGTVAYILIWSALAFLISHLSHRQDAEAGEGTSRGMARIAAAGLVIYVLTATLASVHWVMSLDPHWFSSLFGMAFVAGHALSAWAFSIPMLIFLSRRKPLAKLLPAKRQIKIFHDFGKLMLAFVALWAYFTVSQFLIIWSGNLPEEVTWYLERAEHGWKGLSVALVVGHFAVPFLLLLSRDLKKRPGRLVWVAVWLLAMRWFDLFWQVTPSVVSDASVLLGGLWLDLAAPLGFLGLWVGLLAQQMKNRALVPVRDPAFSEVLTHG